MDQSDEILIQETLDGSLSAFDKLMVRYQQLVFKVAYSFGGNRDNALDISQTVFFKVWEKLHTFRSESSFKSWLLRIAYNEGINWTQSPRNRRDLHEQLDDSADYHASEAAQESKLLQIEQRRILDRGLSSLNNRYRTAILLRYSHEMSIREIAGVLQCSETMTKNILFRSIRNLKKALVQAG